MNSINICTIVSHLRLSTIFSVINNAIPNRTLLWDDSSMQCEYVLLSERRRAESKRDAIQPPGEQDVLEDR